MLYILRLYNGNNQIEKEITTTKNLTVGSDKECDIQSNLISHKKIVIGISENDWNISGLKGVIKNTQYSEDSIPFEKIVILDNKNGVAVTVYQSGLEFSNMIDIYGKEKFTVGRNTDNDISVDSNLISGKHIEFSRSGRQWKFRDLGSTNGTYINGNRMNAGSISPNDELTIGFCRITISNDKVFITYNGKVSSNINIKDTKGNRSINSIDDPYPYMFKQSPRLKEEISDETIELQAPPTIGGAPQISWINVLLTPMLTVAVMLAICLFVTGVMTMLYFSAPMTLIGTLMAVMRYRGEKKKFAATEATRVAKYDQYIEDKISYIENLANEQRRILNDEQPSAVRCVKQAENVSRTLWDRKRRDSDFMSLRIGYGTVKASFSIKAPKKILSMEEDELLDRPTQIVQEYSDVDDCPITINLGEHPMCGVIGDREKVIALGKNLLVQATARHSYDDLRVVVICDADEQDEWDFCRWLPHIYDDTRQMRYYADNTRQAEKLLDHMNEVLSQRIIENRSNDHMKAPTHKPFYLFVCASMEIMENNPIMRILSSCDKSIGAGAIFMFGELDNLPNDCYYVTELTAGGCQVYEKDRASNKQRFYLDKTTNEMYEKYARSLAPIRIELTGRDAALPNSISFLQAYRAKTPQMLRLEENWGKNHPENSMAVPIGVKSDGTPFMFDIHEKYHGPHGLVAGMTGSGKSEMIQSWILSMAIKFSPDEVSFVLIDFKGTGLILPFKNLPHLAGTISDLDTSIGRNLIALENELNRRKAILDKHGVSNISSYLKLVRQGKATEPLPYLFIVIDEFAEFKLRFPEFMQAVNRVFAIGRTLGVHMILLTQKPANVVDDKMNANTRFRWCLKVASSADSRDMLHHPDAAKITNPGRAFVQVGEDEVYEQVQSYWSGAQYNPYRDINLQRSDKISAVDIYGNRVSYEPEKTTGYRSEKNEIDAIVEYMDTYARKSGINRAKAIWTSKLPEKVTLKDILQVAFDGENWGKNDQSLRPAIGKLDDPQSQSQYPLYLDFLELGHTAIYGAPGTGKTTLLHTIIMSLALSYSPDAVNMYLMDFGGGSLNLFRDIPHVGGVVSGDDDEKMQKLAMIITNEMTRRKQLMAEQGLVNIASYREATGEELPYIVLLLDNFAPVPDMYPDLYDFFRTLARDGSSCGIFFVVTGNNINSINYRINQNIKFSIALRMPDRSSYAEIVGKTNDLEPEDHPGRGLIRSVPPLEFQAALPTDGENEVERVGNIRSMAALMNEKWSGRRAAAIPMVPEVVRLSDYSCSSLFLGVSCQDAGVREIDIENTQYFAISAAHDCSETVHIIAQQIIDKVPVQEVVNYGLTNISGVQSLSANEFDQAIENLMPVLQDRKQTASGSKLPSDQYHYIIVLIGDIQDCFDKISDKTVQRLTSIVTLGTGLNVILMASGTPTSIGKLYYGGDPFIYSLVKKSYSLLIGGSVSEHDIFKTNLTYSEASDKMKNDEAYLIKNEIAEKIKIVQQ